MMSLRSLLIGTVVGCLTGVAAGLGILFLTNSHPELKWIAPFAGAMAGSLAWSLVTRRPDNPAKASEPEKDYYKRRT